MDLTSKFWKVALVCLISCVASWTARAESAETNAWRAATELFEDHNYTLAQEKFEQFLSTFTNSSRRADAILRLACAQLYQSNSAAAIKLLTNSYDTVDNSHKLEYVFWIAKARLDAGDYRNASVGFSNIARNPTAGNTLEAAYDEAECYAGIPDWPRVIALLQQTNGPFRLGALTHPTDDSVFKGAFLLAKALQAQHRYADGEKVVRALDPAVLNVHFQWQRSYLLCQFELAEGRPFEALGETTNLLSIATDQRRRALSEILGGDVLQQIGRSEDALRDYGKAISDGPAEEQRAAIVKTINLTIANNSAADAIRSLEALAAQRSKSPGLDAIWMSLADLYLNLNASPLQQFTEGTNSVLHTNCLPAALTNLNLVLGTSTNAELLARAYLDRGWCKWLNADWSGAHADFLRAVAGLPFSQEQAIARMKLADTEFYLTNYSSAVSNYNILLDQYGKNLAVTNGLFDQALYQIVVADIALHDLPGAEAAARKIITWFPDSYFGDKSRFALGKTFDFQQHDYSKARDVFSDLLQHSPRSPLAPEVEYAIGRSYTHEGNWPAAIAAYERWETNYPRDPLFPQVEFSLAHAYDKAGLQTNAFMRFTNFVARFPSNSLWPWAKNWVADFYYNQENYAEAELAFQQLYGSTNAGDLAWNAHFWAGRAAWGRYDYDAARQYFYELANTDSSNSPPDLAAQAWFAYGDAVLQQSLTPPVSKTNFDNAIYAIAKLTNGAPTNAIAVEAIGRLGDYYMHWANITNAPETYDLAAQMYRAILSYAESARISVSARCQAEVGLGEIAEKQHRLDEALEHYSKIVYGYDSDHFDPYWIWRAGEFAGRIYESLRKWDEAAGIYRRVLKADPSLRPVLEQKIAAAQAHAQARRD